MNEDDLRARFSVCDTDKSGDLDREEYEEFYAKTKIQNSITETKVNHEMVPGSASSKKRFQYLVLICLNLEMFYFFSKSASNVQEPRTVSDMNKTEIAFSLYDDNRDGYVTSQEMMKRSKALTKAQVDKVNLEKCSLGILVNIFQVFQKFDLDGDGRLSFNEFKKMMIKHQANA